MRALYLIRHSLTEANERRLYGGSTDIPLTEGGRAIALSRRGAVPDCDISVSSGMMRANETLELMTGHAPGLILPELREMDFGAFEMRGYDALKDLPEFIQWIGDEAGLVCCPGGECLAGFRERVRRGGMRLLALDADDVLAVCHGGVIVSLMQAWFPEVQRHFYQWQPGACRGYRIALENRRPSGFEEV